jgi:Uma2 family endonuclease
MAAVLAPSKERVVLHDISWECYEHLLKDLADRSGPRLTYDKGVLEIMSPLPEHERPNRAIAQVVSVVAEEWDIELEDLGSTTFRREDLARGFEPDSCFYIQHADQIRGKNRIDLTTDPPPDLVIEIDITSPSFPKLPIYAQLGVPEVWRYDGNRLSVLRLEGGEYREVEESLALPGLTSSVLTRFLEDNKTLRRTEWLRAVREWLRLHEE